MILFTMVMKLEQKDLRSLVNNNFYICIILAIICFILLPPPEGYTPTTKIISALIFSFSMVEMAIVKKKCYDFTPLFLILDCV